MGADSLPKGHEIYPLPLVTHIGLLNMYLPLKGVENRVDQRRYEIFWSLDHPYLNIILKKMLFNKGTYEIKLIYRLLAELAPRLVPNQAP